MKPAATAMLALLTAVAAVPAAAHMQVIGAPALLIDRPSEIALMLDFGHADGSGPMLDMPVPEKLTLIHRIQRSDLMPSLRATSRGGASAFDLDLGVRDTGDYIVALQGGLYHDASEGGYVQPFAKAVLNFGGIPTDWDDQIGMAVEIVPMVKPYAVIAGSTFTGRVVTPRGAVPYQKVDLVRLPAYGAAPEERPWPGSLTVVTDGEGIFTIGIPASGPWLLAAYGAGPVRKTPEGKSLTQDAILMIEAHDWFN